MEQLGRAGRKLRQHTSGFYLTDCPYCQQNAWVLPTGLFCDAVDCRFTAGGPLEIEMILGKHRNFYDAAFALRKLFSDRTQLWGLGGEVQLLQKLASQASFRRSLFEFLMRSQLERQALGEVGILYEMTNVLTAHMSRQTTLFMLGPKQLEKLMDFLKRNGIRAEAPTDKAAVLLPLFSKHHTVSTIIVWSPADHDTHEITVDPSRFAFSGLLNSSPGAVRTYAVGDPFQALNKASHVDLTRAGEQVLGIIVDSTVPTYGLMPPLVYSLGEKESPSFGSTLRQADPNMKYALGEIPTEHVGSWFDLVKYVVQQRLRESGGSLDNTTLLFAQGADLLQDERTALVHWMRAQGYAKASAQLVDRFNTRILIRDRDITLYETPEGYTVTKDRRGLRDAVTNFTLNFDRNIIFPEQLEVYHGGILQFDGATHPVVLGSEDIESGPKCQAAAREALLKQGVSLNSLPTVNSSSHFKLVAAVLRSGVTNLQPASGVATLGWHHDRQSFTAPQWKLSMDGTQPGPFDFHPKRIALSFFKSSKPKMTAFAPPELPAGLADLCRLVLAGVFRSFAHMPVEGIPLEQTQFAQHAVSRVFEVLGQKRPINGNGLRPDGLGRWPVYGFEHQHAALRTSDNFIFGFCDRGFKLAGITSEIPDALLEAVGQWLNWAIHHLCTHLIAEGSMGFERRRRVLYFCELLEEGTVLMNDLFGIGVDNWSTQPENFDMMERLLSARTDKNYKDLYTYSYRDQRVSIYHGRVEGIDEGRLSEELQKISDRVEFGADCITLPSPPIHSVLRHYYSTEISFNRAD